MANVKISEFPQAVSLSPTDVLASVAGSTTSKITVQDLANSLTEVSSSISSSYAVSASYAPSSVVSMAVSSSGSTIYSVNPATSNFSANYGIFLGYSAGFQATSAEQSNFLGLNAGEYATNAQQSNFLGSGAGNQATNAFQSNFLGLNAGSQAAAASNSNILGNAAGYQAANASYSNLFGASVGRKTYGSGIGSNNIIIGTNITLENDRKDSINLGGVIFATGSYSDTGGETYSGSVQNAKVGINKSLPEYTLDISGSLAASSLVVLSEVSASLNFVDDAAAAAGGVPLGGLYRNGNFIVIRLS